MAQRELRIHDNIFLYVFYLYEKKGNLKIQGKSTIYYYSTIKLYHVPHIKSDVRSDKLLSRQSLQKNRESRHIDEILLWRNIFT